MEPRHPRLVGEGRGQRVLAKLQDEQGEDTAEQRGIQKILVKVRPAEPQSGRSRELGVTAADPAAAKEHEADRKRGQNPAAR